MGGNFLNGKIRMIQEQIKSEVGGDENYAGDTGVAFDFVGTVDTGLVFEHRNLVFYPFRGLSDCSVWVLVGLYDRKYVENDKGK